MKCFSPVSIKNPYFGRDPTRYALYHPDEPRMLVPCGKCFACQNNKRRAWFVRVKTECDCYQHNAFITLSIDPEWYEIISENPVQTFQNFMKRLRKRIDHKLKVFGITEFGPKFGRLHYHCIIFNLDARKYFDLIHDCWKYGFITIAPVTDARINYLSKYCLKYYQDERHNNSFISNSIGFTYLEEHGLDLLQDHNVSIDGRHYAIPRYYKDKLFAKLPYSEVSDAQLDYKAAVQKEYDRLNAIRLTKLFHRSIRDETDLTSDELKKLIAVEEDKKKKFCYHCRKLIDNKKDL